MTARILQVSPTKTTTYDMPMDLYHTMQDIMDNWWLYHSRRDKCTVEKVISLLSQVIPDVRDHITIESKATKPELRGLRGEVWYDEVGLSKGEV